MKKYIVRVIGGVEPEVIGPYKTNRDNRAKELYNAYPEDAIFWLNVSDRGHPTVGPYSNKFMEE